MARQKPIFKPPSSSRTTQSLLLLTVLLLAPTKLLLTTTQPGIRWVLAAINLFTFQLYYRDKRAAESGGGRWRVRETTLHLWALAGGWPAAWVAQGVLRHKTRKTGFLAVFYGIVALEEAWCLRRLGWL